VLDDLTDDLEDDLEDDLNILIVANMIGRSWADQQQMANEEWLRLQEAGEAKDQNALDLGCPFIRRSKAYVRL